MTLAHLFRRDFIHGKEFPMNTVVLRLDNGTELICSNFNCGRKNEMELLCYFPAKKKWGRHRTHNKYTEAMWNYYYGNVRKRSKGTAYYENLMHHERVHKHGSGGSRLGNNNTVTDYECTKEPMHDFKRSMWVQWN